MSPKPGQSNQTMLSSSTTRSGINVRERDVEITSSITGSKPSSISKSNAVGSFGTTDFNLL